MRAAIYLDPALIDSEVWCLPDDARILYLALALMVDDDWVARASRSGVVRRAGLSPEAGNKALTELISRKYIEWHPDGCRVLKHDHILLRSHRQVANARRQREYRARKRAANGG